MMNTMNIDEVKLCKNCKYYESGGTYYSDKCIRPQLGFDLVDGEPNSKPCHSERYSFSGCSKLGRFFEPIPKKGLWKDIKGLLGFNIDK